MRCCESFVCAVAYATVTPTTQEDRDGTNCRCTSTLLRPQPEDIPRINSIPTGVSWPIISAAVRYAVLSLILSLSLTHTYTHTLYLYLTLHEGISSERAKTNGLPHVFESSNLFLSLLFLTSLRCLFAWHDKTSEAVGYRLLSLEARVWFQARQCGICGGQSGTWTGLCQSISGFLLQYLSINAPYSYFIHLPLMLYNVNNWQLC